MTVQEYLKEKPLLFDGAMGTYLVEKHPETVKRNCEFMNIEHPEWVQKIHEKYLKAGAVAIKTNTFSANTVVLQQPVEKVKEMIKKGYQIAQNAIKDLPESVLSLQILVRFLSMKRRIFWKRTKKLQIPFWSVEPKIFFLKPWRAEKPLKKLHRISKRKHREVLSLYLLRLRRKAIPEVVSL